MCFRTRNLQRQELVSLAALSIRPGSHWTDELKSIDFHLTKAFLTTSRRKAFDNFFSSPLSLLPSFALHTSVSSGTRKETKRKKFTFVSFFIALKPKAHKKNTFAYAFVSTARAEKLKPFFAAAKWVCKMCYVGVSGWRGFALAEEIISLCLLCLLWKLLLLCFC